jgi:hypothetical protein
MIAEIAVVFPIPHEQFYLSIVGAYLPKLQKVLLSESQRQFSRRGLEERICHNVNTRQASGRLCLAGCPPDVRYHSRTLFQTGKFGSYFAQIIYRLSPLPVSLFYCPESSTAVTSFASLSSVIASRTALPMPTLVFPIFRNQDAKGA